ncbi:MAG TPA: Clp protease N-terminal domain-containing protein [Candidatus Angelobacter sp.]|nr:Clp protease N-terminal domain-containing protein [Candidatus Angelobacter sp.]
MGRSISVYLPVLPTHIGVCIIAAISWSILMFERYTEKARRVIFFARYEASQFGSPYIETEHMLLGLLREDKALTQRFLRSHEAVDEIRRQIESATIKREKTATSVDLPLSNENKRVLAYAAEEAERLSHKHIGTEHILLGLLREEKCFAAQLLHNCNVRISFVREALEQAPHEEDAGRVKRSGLPSDCSVFLSKLAKEERLLPCIGREKEIEQVIQILGRSTKNNVVLVGESGVGKRTIAEGVVQRVADNAGPVFLHNKLFAAVDLATLIAAAQQSTRHKEFLDVAAAELITWGNNTIFVFDDLHTLLAGAEESVQKITLLLKSVLLDGKVRCIALATPEDHHAAIQKARWLDGCFCALAIEPTKQDETVKILQGIKGRFEKFHSVEYTDDALTAAVVYSSRYVKNRPLPDKAIDLIDDAGSYLKMKHGRAIPQEIVEATEKIRFIVRRMEDAVAHQEFEKARFFSEEERKQREALQELQKKFQIELAPAGTVTAEHVEEALARWLGVSVGLIRRQPAAEPAANQSSQQPKTGKKPKKKKS